jgi:hypothetical protein
MRAVLVLTLLLLAAVHAVVDRTYFNYLGREAVMQG